MKKLFKSKRAVVSTQRLLTIFIAMNLLMGLASEFYWDPDTYTPTIVENEAVFGEQIAENVEDAGTYTRIKSSITSTLGDNTIGNTAKWGWELLKIFARGMVPFPFMGVTFDDPIERMVAGILDFFRYIMWVLIIIEIISFIKNKKST